MIKIDVLASSSKGNCYRVTDGSTALLLECGIPFREIQKGLNFQVHDIQGCLITHEHKDHCKAVKDILKVSIPIYTSKGTAEAMGVSGHLINHVKAKEKFTIGTWTILAFDTQHDVAEPLGFSLVNKSGEKLLFATDTYYLRYKFKDLTHIMLECNHASDIVNANVESGALPLAMKLRIMKSHFNLDNVKEFLKANDLSKVQEIHLIHLSDGNSDAARFKKEIQELTGKLVLMAGE